MTRTLTIGIAQRVIVAILHKHVCIFDLHAIGILPDNEDREGVADDAFEVGEEVAKLGGEEGGEFGKSGLEIRHQTIALTGGKED
jgi:hypothetical protein